MQSQLLVKCHALQKSAKTDQEKQKYKIIQQMLETDNCFVHMNANVAINVLMQLGYDLSQAKRLFIKLSSFAAFKEGQK